MTDLFEVTSTADRARLNRMRRTATGLLLLMCAIFITATLHISKGAVWGYVAAFAEAAMVGGLADWFAVTAIFRRPLGLPIPHTGVIANNKDRIARSLGDFVAINFLAPENIRIRLQSQALAPGLARQMADATSATRIANGLIDALPALVGVFDDKIVSEFLRRQLTAFGRDGRLSDAIGQGLSVLTENGRHQPLVDAMVREGWRLLEDNRDVIRREVRERTFVLWRALGMDKQASGALIAALEETLEGMASDPQHPARLRITAMLTKLAEDLQRDPVMRARVEAALAEILSHPDVDAYLSGVWVSVSTHVRAIAENQTAPERAKLATAIAELGTALQRDTAVLAAIDTRLKAFITELSARYGSDLGNLIFDTIRQWDTGTIVAKLEEKTGPDLQFIRINGTLIGGFIGLVIHQISIWLHG